MFSDPRSILARVLAQPSCAESLGREETVQALREVAEVQSRLAAALKPDPQPSAPAATRETLLTPAETAARLGVTKRWLYRNSKRLPFTRKLTNRTVRFHEQGLAKYIRERKP